jgi:hypothetical protein
MNTIDELIAILEHPRLKMMACLDHIDVNRQVYSLWTIREVLAHLSGWDDAAVGFMKSILADKTPLTPAADGIDVYNASSVAARVGMDYDQVRQQFITVRVELLALLKQIPEEKLTTEYILPWGEPGTLVDIIHIYGPHEEEHVESLQEMIDSLSSE